MLYPLLLCLFPLHIISSAAGIVQGDFMNNATEAGIDKSSLSSHNTEKIVSG
jgi:hypothetical protein